MDYSFQQVYLHSFIAFCYQEGKYNPNDILTPLVKKTIATLDKKNFTTKEIHDALKKDFSKDFPHILIEKELRKLVHNEILIRNPEKKTDLTYSLVADLSEIKSEYMKSQRETDFFIEEFQRFLLEKKSTYHGVKNSALFKRFEDFCTDNIASVIQYLGGVNSSIKIKHESNEIDLIIEDFFETHVKNDQRLEDEFENIFNGINLLRIAETCSDNLISTNYSIGEKIFYLDTNVLLRILELQSDYLNILGKELIELLKTYDFGIRVFKNTIDELLYLLRGYKQGYQFFIKGRNISHVYQTLKNRNIEPFEIDEIIDNIPEKLDTLGIDIDYTTVCKPSDACFFEQKITELAKIKYDKRNDSDSEFDINDFNSQKFRQQAKHDLEAIESIRTLRATPIINKFEDAKYYFITAESNLLRFNKQKYHYTNIDETIGDYTISFLLYFYKPGNMKGVSLRSFIAANCSNKQLSIANWITYVNSVSKKYKDGSINKTQFGYLLTRSILNNEKFISEDLDDIVNNGITEFNTLFEKYETLRKEKNISDSQIENLKRTNALILNDSENKEIQLIENAKYISELNENNSTLETKIGDLDEKVFSLNGEVNILKKQMRFIRTGIFVLFGILIILGLVFILSNKQIGSVLTLLSIIGTVLNIIDYFKKWLIKD